MNTSIYPWQEDAWSTLQQLRARLPHAVLFHGPVGTGKSHFIEHFAQALLCENVRTDGHPCNACASCGWFVQGSHPDFRRIRPEALDEEAGEEGEGDDKKKTKPSKEIKIEQVRALADFMNISTHRQGLRVVVLYPAEALNTPASNALLKTLEEPPPGTVFLLASNSLDRLLPTILSRCRKFALPMPAHAAALAWLQAQGVADADGWLSEQGGAPLAALAQAETGNREEMDTLLQYLARPSVELALRTADKMQKVPLTSVVAWQQRWLYDLFSMKLTGRIRYYPRYQRELKGLADRVAVAGVLAAIKATAERRATSDHPLSPKLFLEDMLLDYSASCAG
ncbi:DNA polymerase III subunit delta' [Pseudoduganella lurida]|uniref:DNA polymerase III subunit delta' n=1 Tax=Pseudoduganella lurida TaxID=1036180 RepID=UPI0011A32388|nr:DNA polymerase III subunit delta' [Pseudoduganella lurida]